MTGMVRTPFDDPNGSLWIDSDAWDVRFDTRNGSKTVFGNIAHGSVLWSTPVSYRLEQPTHCSSLSFTISQGLAAEIAELTQPVWWSAMKRLFAADHSQYSGEWTRVGVRNDSDVFDLSIPSMLYEQCIEELELLGWVVVRVRAVPSAPLNQRVLGCE